MYVSVILPTLGPAFLTSGFLMLLGVVSMYELVIALTGGGPGISTEVRPSSSWTTCSSAPRSV
jgi:glucose/mannose transport system permease protein